MSVQWLFLRWLLIFGAIAAAIVYLRKDGADHSASSYESVPLIRGERASGMPLAGISVDPTRRDVYAVIGNPPGGMRPLDFFIVWKAPDGRSYAATFRQGEEGAGLFEISPDGQVKVLHGSSGAQQPAAERSPAQIASLDAQLRPLLESLPGEARQPF